ncbi:MAG: glycoside hydrolase family 127 protein [Microbacterium sp.]
MITGPVAPTASAILADRPLPFDAVRLREAGMLGAWQRRNRATTLAHCIRQLESGGALPNMRRVTGETDAGFTGFHFSDSDIYKVLEAIGWEAARSDISEFLPFVDDTVDLLCRAQRDDGYLNSFFQSVEPDRVFADFRWGHELYCLGHLLQAGIAWARTLGRRDLLEIGLRFVDLVDERFGPDGESVVCGHAEIETALVELYRLTGEARHLALAQAFIDRRGHRSVGEDRFGYHYFQDHEPVRQVTDATGHAVRQLYLAAGAADLAAESADAPLAAATGRIWDSAFHEKQYITGGLGSRHRDEAFGDPFELPSDRAYAETCASIAGFHFSWRMLLATGRSAYADEMERALVNAIAESTSLDGVHFFYSNPLQVRSRRDGEHEQAPSRRVGWYDCACCPPNLARLVSSLQHYIASVPADGTNRLRLHLLADAEIDLALSGVGAGKLRIRTDYPWQASAALDFDAPFGGALEVRMPAWTEHVSVQVDGAPAPQRRSPAGYLVIDASEAPVRSIVIEVAMPVQVRQPHPHMDACRGAVAVTRGPVVYCLEQADLPDGVAVEDITVDPDVVPQVADPVIAADGWRAPSLRARAWVRRAADEPYPVRAAPQVHEAGIDMLLVPYALWANRAPGAMRVWLPYL